MSPNPFEEMIARERRQAAQWRQWAAEAEEFFGRTNCEFCGEPFKGIRDEVGEFVDPADPNEHKICHAQCGLDNQWELA